MDGWVSAGPGPQVWGGGACAAGEGHLPALPHVVSLVEMQNVEATTISSVFKFSYLLWLRRVFAVAWVFSCVGERGLLSSPAVDHGL